MADVEVPKGQSISHVCRKLGISEQTYYKWRKEYGGMKVEQAKRLKELQSENIRLKKLVADLSLDKEILKDELLNGEIFETLLEAKVLIEEWRKEYNAVRPHSSLDYKPPATEFIEPVPLLYATH